MEEVLKGMIFQALGEASMCWSETPHGVFDDTKAIKIGDELINKIEREFISFGAYLLSDFRSKTIIHDEMKVSVGHHDIENWKHLKSNIKNQ